MATGDRVIGELVLVEQATPGNPAAGSHSVYFKSDGRLYILDSAGNEREIGVMPNLDDIFVQIAGLTTATTLYTGGDVLGNEMTFPVCAASGKGAVINDASYAVLKPGVILGALDLYLFKVASIPAANNLPADWADGDVDDNFLGMITFEKPTEGASNGVARAVAGLPLTVKGSASVNIFGVAVTRVTHTVHFNAATDIEFRLGVAQQV